LIFTSDLGDKRSMSRFKVYSPDQAYLLPPSVLDELGEKHLCFFVRGVVERLDMSVFEQSYSAEGGELYAPQLMLGVWLYAYALGITSARQVERRLVEDLAFRYLAAGERVDNWALSAFRRRHGRALNDAFTQVLEWAQQQGMVKLGRVAIDSTRIAANACKDRVDSEQALRDMRAQLRRQVRTWQKQADRDDHEPGGLEVAIGELNRALDGLPRRLERLKKSGLKKLSRTDEDARFLRQRGGFVLGYTGEIAVSDDHLIVAQRVTQNVTDNGSLEPMLDQVVQRCGAPPGAALADSGFFSIDNIERMEQRNIDAYVPDSNLASELNLGTRCRVKARAAAHRRMRAKLRSPDGEATYARRKAVVEPVFGVLKQQRGLRQFRTRGMQNVNNEFTLATLAFNITRLHAMLGA
jgi:transposase